MEAGGITGRGRSTRGTGESGGRGRVRWMDRNDEGRKEGREEGQKGAGRDGYGEATEEKTRLHVTSSPEPIWSQSVFHYQKPHRLYTKLYIRRPL